MADTTTIMTVMKDIVIKINFSNCMNEKNKQKQSQSNLQGIKHKMADKAERLNRMSNFMYCIYTVAIKSIGTAR